MLVAFFLIIVGVNFVLAAREKVFPFILFLTNIFIWLLITGARDEIDLPSYLVTYDRPFSFEIAGFQVAFYSLIDFFRNLSFSFYEFREIFVCCGLVFLYRFISKLTINPHMVYFSYLLYLIFLDYIQFRNFLACSIFYLALVVLILHDNHWKKKYALFVVIASLFHSSFLVYLLLLLIPSDKWNESKVMRCVASFSVVFSIFALFSRNSISFITDLVYLVDVERSARYADKATNFGGLYFITLQVLSCALMYFFVRNCDNGLINRCIVVGNRLIDVKKSLRIIFYVDLLSLAFCPLVIFSITYYRLLRNLYLLNVIGFSLYGKKNRSALTYIFLLAYIYMWIHIDFRGVNFQRLVFPLFFSNLYFN